MRLVFKRKTDIRIVSTTKCFFLLVEKENWDEKPCAKAIRQIYSNDKIQWLDSELSPV